MKLHPVGKIIISPENKDDHVQRINEISLFRFCDTFAEVRPDKATQF